VSIARLHVLAVRPGTAAAYPEVTGARAIDIARTIGTVIALKKTEFFVHDGKVYLDFGLLDTSGDLNTIQLDRNARGVWTFENGTRAWLTGWGFVDHIPELGGATIAFKVNSKNFVTKEEKATEVFRFVVPSAARAEFVAGAATDQQLIERSYVLYAPDPKASLARIELDLSAGAR